MEQDEIGWEGEQEDPQLWETSTTRSARTRVGIEKGKLRT